MEQPDNKLHPVVTGHQFAVDSSHGPDCNAEEPACSYQICTPDVPPPAALPHPLQSQMCHQLLHRDLRPTQQKKGEAGN